MEVGIVDREKLVNIADALRKKTGIIFDMTLDEIASNITSIPISDNNANFDFTMGGSDGYLIQYLTKIDLSEWDTSNITDMSRLFYNCSSLTSLDLSKFDTKNVIEMNDMFFDCSKLSNLTLGTDWASNSELSSFDLSSCPLTHESALDVINKLATRSNSPVIKFSNKVGLYQSEIDVATNKGWSVSGCTVLV